MTLKHCSLNVYIQHEALFPKCVHPILSSEEEREKIRMAVVLPTMFFTK